MAIFLTLVFMAIEYFLTFFSALICHSFFTAFDISLAFSTLAVDDYTLEITWFAFTSMANLLARMRAIITSFFVANLST